MGNATHRTTFEFRRSVNDSAFPDPPWAMDNATAQALVDTKVPTKYWKVSGDVFSEMTQSEKDAVDAAALEQQRDDVAADLDLVEGVIRAFALAVLDELNNHADKINAILDAADNAVSLADFKARMRLISDYPQRTVQQLKTAVRAKIGN